MGIDVPPGTSYVSRRLAEDPELRARCEEVVRAIREAAREDIEAGERASRITAADLAVTITPCPIEFD